jgi:hypothetical protein
MDSLVRDGSLGFALAATLAFGRGLGLQQVADEAHLLEGRLAHVLAMRAEVLPVLSGLVTRRSREPSKQYMTCMHMTTRTE